MEIDIDVLMHKQRYTNFLYQERNFIKYKILLSKFDGILCKIHDRFSSNIFALILLGNIFEQPIDIMSHKM